MNLLFQDRLAPITSAIGFIETDLRDAVDGFCRWQEPIQGPRGVILTTRPLEGDLRSALMALPPLTSVEARRFLFVSTNSRWTAFFDNGHLGTDAFGPMGYLARTLRCRALRVVAVPHHEPKQENGRWRGRYGAMIFDLYGSDVHNYSNLIRSIAMINDGGKWTFDELGDRLAFENTETYNARRIRDRFPFELLAYYLKQVGLEPFNEEFYGSQAVLVEKHGPCATAMEEYSLEEVRARL